MTRLLAFWALLLAAPASTLASAAALRVATFNLKWLTASATESRMAPWRSEEELAAHRRALAAILARDVRADVLCVLEVTSRAALEKLAAEPALRSFGYRVLHLESGDTGTGQDVAFLVRPRVKLDAFGGALVRRFADTLPAVLASGAEARGKKAKGKKPPRARLTKHAVVCLSAPQKLCVMGVHLLAHPDDRGRTARREVQARIAADIVRREIVAQGYLPVVVGDFNDFDPDVEGPEGFAKGDRKVLRLVKDFDPARKGPELFNAAGRIAAPAARFSAYWDKNRNGRREDREPASLIDHVLLDNALAKRLVSVDIPHAAHDGSTSDHWPVIVELAPPAR